MAEAEELQKAIRDVIGAFAGGALTADGGDPIARVSFCVSMESNTLTKTNSS